MKIMIENRWKSWHVAVWVIISLYVQLIFLFVDGTVNSAIYYKKNFLDGSSVSDYFTLFSWYFCL